MNEYVRTVGLILVVIIFPALASAANCKMDSFFLSLLGHNQPIGYEFLPQCQSLMADKKEAKNESGCMGFYQSLAQSCCHLVQTIASRDKRTDAYDIYMIPNGMAGFEVNCGGVDWGLDGQPKLITSAQKEKEEFESRRKEDLESRRKAKEGITTLAMLEQREKIEAPRKWQEAKGDITSLKPGGSLILDNAVQLKLPSSDPHAVPQIIVKSGCNINSVWGRECLSLAGYAKIYSSSKIYEIRKGPCKIEMQFHEDEGGYGVTQCDIKTYTTTAEPYAAQEADSVKEITIGGAQMTRHVQRGNVNQGYFSVYGVRIGENPFVYLLAQDYVMYAKADKTLVGGRMRPMGYGNPSEGMYTPDDGEWELSVVTNYGVADFSYSPAEFFEKKIKKLVTGPISIEIEPLTDAFNADHGLEDRQRRLRFKIHSQNASVSADSAIILDYGL